MLHRDAAAIRLTDRTPPSRAAREGADARRAAGGRAAFGAIAPPVVSRARASRTSPRGPLHVEDNPRWRGLFGARRLSADARRTRARAVGRRRPRAPRARRGRSIGAGSRPTRSTGGDALGWRARGGAIDGEKVSRRLRRRLGRRRVGCARRDDAAERADAFENASAARSRSRSRSFSPRTRPNSARALLGRNRRFERHVRRPRARRRRDAARRRSSCSGAACRRTRRSGTTPADAAVAPRESRLHAARRRARSDDDESGMRRRPNDGVSLEGFIGFRIGG